MVKLNVNPNVHNRFNQSGFITSRKFPGTGRIRISCDLWSDQKVAPHYTSP